MFPISVDDFPREPAERSYRARVSSGGTVCTVLNNVLKTREVEKENSLLQLNNIEKEWMESGIINPVLQKLSCYVNRLSFNSMLRSTGVCVCIYTFMGVYTVEAYDRMRFDGFLTLRAVHAFVLVCVSERSLHIVIQETHMIACDWGVRHSRLLDFQHKQCSGPARRKPSGCKRPSAPLRDARSAWKHLEGDVLFQALKAGGERCRNYLAVSVPLSLRHAQLPARGEKWKVKRT